MNVIYDSDTKVPYYYGWLTTHTHSVLLMTVWTSCIMLCSENR